MVKRAEIPTINSDKMQTSASKNTFLKLIKAFNEANEYGRRHDYSFRHSQGRTESTKDLTEAECWMVISELHERFCIAIDDDMDTMRKKIIALAHGMSWQMNGKADMQRINTWCINKGPYHKPLMAHKRDELITLVSVFEKVYKHHMNKL